MSAKGRQWPERDLRVSEVRLRDEFQLRAGGLDRPHVKRLRRALEAGEALPPVRVAAIGKALYLVDGFDRLEAHWQAGRETIRAGVAHMALGEARAEAQRANTRHGKGLNRADKGKLWDDVVAAGGHRDARGLLKSARVLEAELGGVISRETIRKKLLAMGLEDELEPVKPWGGAGEADADFLAAERVQEAESALRAFGELIPTLDREEREALLGTARAVLDALERGETPELLQDTSLAALAERMGI